MQRARVLTKHLLPSASSKHDQSNLHAQALSHQEKEHLYEHGYVILRNAVSLDACARARSLIVDAGNDREHRLLNSGTLTGHDAVLGLLEESCLRQLLESDMGPFPPVVSSQIAFTPPSLYPAVDGRDQKCGVVALPEPYVDGAWSGLIPETAQGIDMDAGRPIDAARWFGENEDRRGTNDGQLWHDPARTVSTGSYTCLVGVALNDQTVLGPNGQFSVLSGSHKEVEAQFKRQRDAGGIIGPEGPGWPRIKVSERGQPYLNGLFDKVRETAFVGKVDKEAAWPWPELTPCLLGEGDAVVALHSLPHCATPNLCGATRMNVYFRVRRLRPQNPHEGSRKIGHGVSDHPDLAYFGNQLEYPQTYNPWQTSLEKVCDHWSEWDGMQAIVEKARGNSEK